MDTLLRRPGQGGSLRPAACVLLCWLAYTLTIASIVSTWPGAVRQPSPGFKGPSRRGRDTQALTQVLLLARAARSLLNACKRTPRLPVDHLARFPTKTREIVAHTTGRPSLGTVVVVSLVNFPSAST